MVKLKLIQDHEINCKEYFSICHWNLNSISAHDFSQLFLLKTYIILNEFDIICLLETYVDSTAPTDDGKLQIPGYTLIPWYEKGSEVPLFKSGPPPI